MNATRMWTLVSIIIIIAVVAGSWFIGISPRLSQASVANEAHAAVEAQNAAQTVALAALKEQFEGIDELKDALAASRTSVPSDADISDLITQIDSLAANAGVTVSSITVRAPSAYAPIENPSENPELAAALASVTPETFFVIPVDISVSGIFQSATAFVASLQTGQRLFLVHDLTLASGTMAADSVVDLNISGQIFVLLSAGATPPTVPAAPSEEAELPEGADVPQ